jgi:hypothetical protein
MNTKTTRQHPTASPSPPILMAEDSLFFKRFLKPSLKKFFSMFDLLMLEEMKVPLPDLNTQNILKCCFHKHAGMK